MPSPTGARAAGVTPAPIEDYALIGDLYTAALVGRSGSIDWLCVPRFDSAACFAGLLGDERHGHWRIAPRAGEVSVQRRYRDGTLVLETEFATGQGAVRLTDFMPPRDGRIDVVRIVEGVRGRVPMECRLAVRFGYGKLPPWVEEAEHGFVAIGGPDALVMRSDVDMEPGAAEPTAYFSIAEGERAVFVLTWHPSHEPAPEPLDALAALENTTTWWRQWSGRCDYASDWHDLVVRSLITLKALTYAPTGGVIAAPTTSLPEALGGVRNWDYRYCWVRDATFTLQALLTGGFTDEAVAWRDWLLRAVAGEPAQMQIMYGAAGERLLPEVELDWLPGYEGCAPVRIGNAAADQFQLDVFGEVMDLLHQARRSGIQPSERAWDLQTKLVEFVDANWREPDNGIWEMRGPRRQFTHSKLMAWVAIDRAVRGMERFDLPGDLARWRALRTRIHDSICDEGWNERRQAFTQSYGSDELDASLLMMPLVGFLPPEDKRVRSTVDAIERDLTRDGFVLRYRTDRTEDGLPEGEGAFLACTLWLADVLALIGRRDDARSLLDRVAGTANDVGLLAEQFDPAQGRLVGNFPQALSHIALVATARSLTRPGGPVDERREA